MVGPLNSKWKEPLMSRSIMASAMVLSAKVLYHILTESCAEMAIAFFCARHSSTTSYKSRQAMGCSDSSPKSSKIRRLGFFKSLISFS